MKTYKQLSIILIFIIYGIFSNIFAYSGGVAFSIFGKYNQQDREYANKGDVPDYDVLARTKPKYNAFGFTVGGVESFYGFKFDYGKYFEGERATASLAFNHRGFISPYVGFSLVRDTEKYVVIKRKNYYLDGYDIILGLSASLINVVKVHLEYSAYTSLYSVGASVHIPIKFSFNKGSRYFNIDLGE